VLFDWPGDHLFWPSLTVAEATRAGALAAICTCLPGGRYYQSPGAPRHLRRDLDRRLSPTRDDRQGGRASPDRASTLTATSGSAGGRRRAHPGATAHNTLGTLPGRQDGPPIVVAGHHDCWFAAGAARRAAFATVARALEAVDARDKQSLLHLQALTDVESLDAACIAFERRQLGVATREAARVGRSRLARHVTSEVFGLDQRRYRPEHPGYGWAAHARPTRSPNLWVELASLRREAGARAPGPWLASSLASRRARSARELQRRLDGIASVFDQAAEQLCNG